MVIGLFYDVNISIKGNHKYSKAETIQLNKKNENLNAKRNERFVSVQIFAVSTSGEDGFREYLKNNIVYPDSATISDVNGTVKVGFTIDKEGLIKNVVLLKGVNKFADEAVIIVIKKMTKWKPAVQNGNYIEQYREVSISFNIDGRVD